MVAYAARPRVVLVRAVAIALGGDACGASTAARPCRRDDQCEPGETCARRADDVVDACKPTSADQGEGAPREGVGEGEGDLGPTARFVDVGARFVCAIDGRAAVQRWGPTVVGSSGALRAPATPSRRRSAASMM